MSVKNTPFTITDSNGNPLCHSRNAHKRNADSKRKRAVREATWSMFAAAGMYDAATDEATCAVSGARMPRNSPAVPQAAVTAGLVIDSGHVISDAHDGPFCPCNMVPELRAVNLTHGDKDMPAITRDPRVMWRAIWTATATASKARKAA